MTELQVPHYRDLQPRKLVLPTTLVRSSRNTVEGRILTLLRGGPLMAPTTFETHPGPGFQHVLSLEQYWKHCASSNEVAIQTGFLGTAPGWITLQLFVEQAGFYVHGEVGVREISSGQLRKMLLGELRDWSQLGGKRLPIIIARLRPSVAVAGYVEALDARFWLLVNSMGVDFREAVAPVETTESYRQLAGLARYRPGVIAIGLREASFRDLCALRLDGHRFNLCQQDSGYPVAYRVGMSIRDNDLGWEAAGRFVAELDRRRRKDLRHWLREYPGLGNADVADSASLVWSLPEQRS